MAFDYKEWYKDNKDRIAQRRKQLYHTDPAYRQVVINRAREARERVRPPPVEASGLIRAVDAGNTLGVSPWTLHTWKTKGYYPEPQKVGGRPVFTQNQVQLLGLIKQFFETYPKRLAGLHRDQLKVTVEVVHQNWSA